ncbi:MAG: hypothetical protein ACI857_000252 [Arenicella sp.]|jgi:hypothetical protein
MKIFFLLLLFVTTSISSQAQQVPAIIENIPFLCTFGKDASKGWGDDDFSQTFFFVIPSTHKDPVYIRVYDPGTGGKHDEQKGVYNTKTKFSVYGGKGCITDKDARGSSPVGNYKSGNLLHSKSFTDEYDDKWYTFGPLNPTSGENAPKFGGNIFKIIAEGTTGDDGNLYRYHLSTSPDKNIDIEGGNAFTYEYTFRMHEDPKEVSHVYPYIDNRVVSVKQGNFDWDNDGELKIITNSRYAIFLKKSGQGNWMKSEHKIYDKEKESTFDVQFHKNKKNPAKNNNVTFYITNQYGEMLPFFTIPIGGVPKPKTNIKITPK